MSVYETVKLWNERCGNTPEDIGTQCYWKSIENQLERIKEELDEAYEALGNHDLQELLDATVDLDVVVNGLAFLHGMKHQEGVNRVMDNNDLKWTRDDEVANFALAQYEEYEEEPFYMMEQVVGGKMYYTVRRLRDNKIMKLQNHPKVDLSDLIPNID